MGSLARVITASKPARQISRPLGASTLYTKVSAISGFSARRDPHCGAALALTEASASRAANPQRSASWPPHLLRGSPEAPIMHRVGRDQHVAPVLQGRTTPTTTPPQEQATGLGHTASVGTTPYSQHMYCPCPPFNYKRRGLGPLRREIEGEHLVAHTHTHPSRLRAMSQVAHTTPRRDLGLAPSLPVLVTPYY